jgi:type I restriction enzyme M protein
MTTNRKQLNDRLWASAQQLRANSSLKLNEISEPILGLIFLKFADVRFRQALKTIELEQAKIVGRKPPITPEHFKQKGVPFIPDGAGYQQLMDMPESMNIGKAVNEAMKAIEASNPELAGILPQSYTTLSAQQTENSQILITMLKNFNQIPEDIEGDAFGEIYEFFLGEFARDEGGKGGEFFTPQSIVQLIVEILEPYKGKIYDPACGSGGMFVHSAQFVAQHNKGNKSVMEEVSIYGQEKGASNMRVAKMNLAIHGLSGRIELANSFYEDVHDSIGKFDYVLANPPFNVKGKDKNGQTIIDALKIISDPRYNLGLPATAKGEITNANYLWMQMFASALSPTGRAGFVMANSAGDAGHKEKELRQKIVESGIVDVIISVGTNMFLNAPLPCTLWFFDKGKSKTDRKNQILFINVQDVFTFVDKAHNTWTPEQITEISEIVKRYRGEDPGKKFENIKGRCHVATIDDVISHDYSLNPGRYIEIVDETINSVDFDSLINAKKIEFIELTSKANSLEKKIQESWKQIK